MKYVGLQQQITSNNRKSILLLMAFPFLVLVMVFAFFVIINYAQEEQNPFDFVLEQFITAIPYVFLAVGIWFLIAYFTNSTMINKAAKSHSLSRKDNMRVYNLTENLCMSVGMQMPKLRIIETSALNAFASGINKKNFTVTLTRGIIDELNDEELEGVIAHELMHIRNNDVKLLIVSIVFVGIFSFIMQVALRSMLYGNLRSNRRKDDGKGGAIVMIVIVVLAAIAYFLSILFKLALSRKREYLADSGAAEMTKNPLGLASALEKISGNHHVDKVKSADVQQMFIENTPKDTAVGLSSAFKGLFSTHPPIEKRIEFLRQL
ncbi:protease [Brumimicrobium salinarum]|uniref:Protease HtpX homolog n=1 Tax=Brumimicrobium salinarum TaxID=2058658 RepID=A0A2I0R198_9FLAO|nr:M48 family metallopeptidase [Brumimicrobium salinarum]PKR80354.1 protease [Brumimicrobium salinarum]